MSIKISISNSGINIKALRWGRFLVIMFCKVLSHLRLNYENCKVDSFISAAIVSFCMLSLSK